MRHRKKVKKLGRPTGHRKALLRNLAAQIIQHHEIKTTLAKAKAARGFVERLITYAKNDTVHARRLAFKQLQNRTLVKKLFDEIGPAFEDRNGGYTRVIKLGQRRGDGAEIAILQLVGFETSLVSAPTKSKKKKAAPKEEKAPAKEEKAAATEEVTEEKPAEEPKAKKTRGRKKKAEAPAAEAGKAEEAKAEAASEAQEEPQEAPKADATPEPTEQAASEESTAENTEESTESKDKKSDDKDDSK